MASRAKLDGPSRPMLVPDRWDIPPESKVRITTNEGHKVIGDCYKNPIHTNNTNVIELVNCKMTYEESDKPVTKTRLRFFSHELVSLTWEKKKEEIDPFRDVHPEKLMMTQTVLTMEKLQTVITAIKESNVDKISIKLEGINVSRDGDVGWICFVVKGLLVCIDVITLSTDKKFWKIMEEEVFTNGNLMKIVHNSRPMVDYLFHCHGIKVKNIFDTQVTELYIRCHMNRGRMPKNVDTVGIKGSEYNWVFLPLSKCLEKFVCNLICREELTQLIQYEQMDFTRRNPLMQRPFKPADSMEVKFVALSVKYLLELREVQMKILLSHINDCVHEEIILMMKGNMADHIKNISDPSYVAHNIQEKMVEGRPYLTLDVDKPLD